MPLSVSAFKAQTLSGTYTRSTKFQEWDENLEEMISLEEPDSVQTLSSTYTIIQARLNDLFSSQMTLSVNGTTWVHQDDNQWLKRIVVSWQESFRIPTIQSHSLTLAFMAGWTDTEDEDEMFVVGRPQSRVSTPRHPPGDLHRKPVTEGDRSTKFSLARHSPERGPLAPLYRQSRDKHLSRYGARIR